MKPGELVMITRESIGVPAGTIGFILKKYKGTKVIAYADGGGTAGITLYDIDIVGRNVIRRYLARDLKVISGD